MTLGAFLKYLRDVKRLSLRADNVHKAITDGRMSRPPMEGGRYDFGSLHVEEAVELWKERAKT